MTSVAAEQFHREHESRYCGHCGKPRGACECAPAPSCHGCGATKKADCECDRAENE
jgi:hypothetical protein